MTDNARHVPGSARSRRIPLSRSATPGRRFYSLGKSTYKTQTKCIQNPECDFFNTYASTTYTFNALKCTDFPGCGYSPLPRGRERARGKTLKEFTEGKGRRPSAWGTRESLGQDEGQTGSFRSAPSRGNLLYIYCTESSESANSPIFYRSDHAAPTTYDDQNRRTPIFGRDVAPPTSALCFFVFFAAIPSPSGPKPEKNRKYPEFRFSVTRPPLCHFWGLGFRHSFVICHSAFVIGPPSPFLPSL